MRLLDVMRRDNGGHFYASTRDFAEAHDAIVELVAAGFFIEWRNELDDDYWTAAAGEQSEAAARFPSEPYERLSDALNRVFERADEPTEQSAPAGEREALERELLSVLDFSESNLRRVVDHLLAAGYSRAVWQRTQSAPVSQVERPVPSGWAVKRSDASRHELYGFYDEYLGPLDGWLQDPRRAVLFGNKEAAIAAQAALSVGSKLAISVVWLVYDPVFDTYREQAQ